MLRRMVLISSLLVLLVLAAGCGVFYDQGRPVGEPAGQTEWLPGANPDYFPDVDQFSLPGGYLGGP